MTLRSRNGVAIAVAVAAVALMTTVELTQRILRIEILNVRNSDGVIHILVFDDPSAFDENRYASAYKYLAVPAREGAVSAAIGGVGSGRYAVMFHHDENENSEVDMDGALPTEGWAYSNGAGTQGTPEFADAAFDHAKDSPPLTISMLYAD